MRANRSFTHFSSLLQADFMKLNTVFPTKREHQQGSEV